MRNRLLENKEYCILSRNIDNASKCLIINVSDDCFDVKLNKNGKYEVGETVELFTMTSNGQLYFETIVKSVNDDVLSIWFPISYKYLQRREYSRIQTDKKISMFIEGKEIEVTIIDISAGGLKILANEQLLLSKEYKLAINVDNNSIDCSFEPIRIEVNSNGYVVSGKFNNINSHDRISLVQYCFRKQIENSNK